MITAGSGDVAFGKGEGEKGEKASYRLSTLFPTEQADMRPLFFLGDAPVLLLIRFHFPRESRNGEKWGAATTAINRCEALASQQLGAFRTVIGAILATRAIFRFPHGAAAYTVTLRCTAQEGVLLSPEWPALALCSLCRPSGHSRHNVHRGIKRPLVIAVNRAEAGGGR